MVVFWNKSGKNQLLITYRKKIIKIFWLNSFLCSLWKYLCKMVQIFNRPNENLELIRKFYIAKLHMFDTKNHSIYSNGNHNIMIIWEGAQEGKGPPVLCITEHELGGWNIKWAGQNPNFCTKLWGRGSFISQARKIQMVKVYRLLINVNLFFLVPKFNVP